MQKEGSEFYLATLFKKRLMRLPHLKMSKLFF